MITIEYGGVARTAYIANNLLRKALGETPNLSWDSISGSQRDGYTKAVIALMNNPSTTAEQQHQKWYDARTSEGWVYGPVKDSVLKTHPNLVSYNSLPKEQHIKDEMFRSIVLSIAGVPGA